MSEPIASVVAATAPHALWVVLFAGMFFLIGPERIRDLLARVSKIELTGVKIDLESKLVSAAVARQKNVPRKTTREVADQLRLASGRIAAARILWIDDNPENNLIELRMLKALGATVDLARSNREALKRLQGAVYDLVLSDVGREGRECAGFEFFPELEKAILQPSVIYYTWGVNEGKPAGAYGMTTRPDELMQMIADALLQRSGV